MVSTILKSCKNCKELLYSVYYPEPCVRVDFSSSFLNIFS